LYPDDVQLLFAIASLRLMEGDVDRAVELFRASLEQNPNHVMSLNNLALALSVKDLSHLDESARLLQQAVELAGPQPRLIDSQAVLEILSGRPAQAVTLLLNAVPQADSDGPMFLHLAQAWSALGNVEMARYALDMADSRRVTDQPLLPLDRQWYEQLTATLLSSTP
jgi:Flp pilus assembly protein TadD